MILLLWGDLLKMYKFWHNEPMLIGGANSSSAAHFSYNSSFAIDFPIKEKA
jgi:hypothetical protein